MSVGGWILAAAVLAVLVLVLGVGSTRRAERRTTRRGDGTFRTRMAALDTRGFETLVVQGFRAQGYQPATTVRGRAGELLLRRDRETCLVDCRRWRDVKVGAGAIVATQRAMQARGATSGFALTSGRFSREAAAQASADNIRLIEGAALENLLGPAVQDGRGRPPGR